MSVQAITWAPSGAVRILDQRLLPDTTVYRDLDSADAVAEAIRTLQVRGAPLIGIAAAMGLVTELRVARAGPRQAFLERLTDAANLLGRSRPTAVNLHWALQRMDAVAQRTLGDSGTLWERLRAEATAIWEEDRAMCRRIGEAGLDLLPDGTNVLTHCNAGALATGGIGTALAPIYLAHEAGRRVHVFVDETRPVLQGARLTAWELGQAGVPCTLIADVVAGSLMRAARVDLVLVGADRIASNGDFWITTVASGGVDHIRKDGTPIDFLEVGGTILNCAFGKGGKLFCCDMGPFDTSGAAMTGRLVEVDLGVEGMPLFRGAIG